MMECCMNCPRCHSPMVERTGPHGRFWGCSRFPECRCSVSMSPYPERVNAVVENNLAGDALIRREASKGPKMSPIVAGLMGLYHFCNGCPGGDFAAEVMAPYGDRAMDDTYHGGGEDED